VVSHSKEHKFDAEDGRIVKVLATFASVGHTLYQHNVELLEAKASLEREAQERQTAEAQVRTALEELRRSQAVLTDRNADLERFEQAVVGRELRMIEIEKENARLKAELERSKESPP
jgi:hypothetical protein